MIDIATVLRFVMRKTLFYLVAIIDLWYTVGSRLQDAIWWFRHRFVPRHRYNIVRTGLPPGYYDPDERLIWAFFTTTAKYVEDTEGVIDWARNPEAWAAYKSAADWWKAHKDTLFEDCETDEAEWLEVRKHMNAVTEHLRCMWYL